MSSTIALPEFLQDAYDAGRQQAMPNRNHHIEATTDAELMRWFTRWQDAYIKHYKGQLVIDPTKPNYAKFAFRQFCLGFRETLGVYMVQYVEPSSSKEHEYYVRGTNALGRLVRRLSGNGFAAIYVLQVKQGKVR